jgi:3',5'-cyclic AMP phosphodiesterase CpdA
VTSIIQFSDIHFGAEDKDAMAAVGKTIADLRPDVTVICGDITQNGKLSEFHAARDWITTLAGPKIITPGNHDTPMYGLFQRLFDPFGRYGRIIAPLSEPVYADRYVTIATLNTARGWQAKTDWSLGVVDLVDLRTVITQLESVSASAVKMLAVHHPLIYPPVSPLQKETQKGAEAIRLLCERNIDAVLSGHVHVPFTLERQSDTFEILSIGAGTLSMRRRDKPASFNHIVVDDKAVTVTEVFWEDGRFSAAQPWSKKVSELKSMRQT